MEKISHDDQPSSLHSPHLLFSNEDREEIALVAGASVAKVEENELRHRTMFSSLDDDEAKLPPSSSTSSVDDALVDGSSRPADADTPTTMEAAVVVDSTSSAAAATRRFFGAVKLTTRAFWASTWRAVPYHALPSWLQDNDYLIKGHRPELRSTVECLRSIFRIHTETVNIWTHLLGALLFVYFAIFFFLRGGGVVDGGSTSTTTSNDDDDVFEEGANWTDQVVFLIFFAAAIICMSLSWIFHCMCCHSSSVSLLVVKLDYCGIAILIVGSFVPWLYFGFYCSFYAKCLYVTAIVSLGVLVVVVSSWDKFSLPHFRPLRAALFLLFGLSGIVPALHYSMLEGVVRALTAGGLGWMLVMAATYIFGTTLYALRIPERFFPGKCDIIFQSHQIFHVCVVVGCYVQYHGICQLSEYIRSKRGNCT